MKKSKLKVLFLNHGSEMGGAEVVLLTLLEGIDKNGFECWLVCPESGELTERAGRISGVSVQVIPLSESVLVLRRKAVRSVSALKAIIKLVGPLLVMRSFVRQRRFDLIYTNSTKAHLYGSALGVLTRVPVVWRFHDSLCPEVFDRRLIRIIAAIANKVPKTILCVSESAAAYQRAAGVRGDKVVCLYNGSPAPVHQVKTLEPGALRQAFHLPADCLLVGWFGRLTPWKGVHVLVEAAREVLEKRSDVCFLVVGGSIGETPDYHRSLLAQTERAGVAHRVLFTGYRTDPLSLMQGVDILAHTSILPEPFGMVLVEGALLGKAMIATNAGGVPEIITNDREGLLVAPGNAAALAGAILRLAEDPGLRERLGRAARERAEAFFGSRAYTDNVEAALMNVAARATRQAESHRP